MTMQPGDALLTGQVDGLKVGQAILQLLPSMPHEGPPFMPRAIARQIFPAGFLRQQPEEVPPTVVAPPAVPAAPPPNQGNHPRPPAPAPPAPARQPAPKQDRSFDSEMVTARSQRVRIRERPGM